MGWKLLKLRRLRTRPESTFRCRNCWAGHGLWIGFARASSVRQNIHLPFKPKASISKPHCGGDWARELNKLGHFICAGRLLPGSRFAHEQWGGAWLWLPHGDRGWRLSVCLLEDCLYMLLLLSSNQTFNIQWQNFCSLPVQETFSAE